MNTPEMTVPKSNFIPAREWLRGLIRRTLRPRPPGTPPPPPPLFECAEIAQIMEIFEAVVVRSVKRELAKRGYGCPVPRRRKARRVDTAPRA